MARYVTIMDIASELGLAHSTVSRALKGNLRISAKTRAKVQETAERMGYVPNQMANLLKQGKSNLIAVMVPDITLHFYSRIVQSIQSVLEETKFSMVLYNTFESAEREIECIDQLIKLRVEGVLVAISRESSELQHFEKLISLEIPLVFFDRVANFLPVPKIISDDYSAGFKATSYLIESGCKRIAHITGSSKLNNSNNRLYGYLDALREHGLESHEDLVFYYEFDLDSIKKFIKKILKKYGDLDALFVYSDYIAYAVVNILIRLGKKVPEEISIIGFSDEPVATYMTPKLSTVEEMATKIGEESSRKLLNILNGDEILKDEKIIIPQGLTLRETTK